METRFCQVCGMPMGETDELYGTEKDGTKSKDYCKYCYDKGEFTFKGTMDEMIDICVPNMVKANEGMTEEEARKVNAVHEFPAGVGRKRQEEL